MGGMGGGGAGGRRRGRRRRRRRRSVGRGEEVEGQEEGEEGKARWDGAKFVDVQVGREEPVFRLCVCVYLGADHACPRSTVKLRRGRGLACGKIGDLSLGDGTGREVASVCNIRSCLLRFASCIHIALRVVGRQRYLVPQVLWIRSPRGSAWHRQGPAADKSPSLFPSPAADRSLGGPQQQKGAVCASARWCNLVAAQMLSMPSVDTAALCPRRVGLPT